MKSRILMFFAIAFIGISGCSDPCDDVTCLNNGVCNDGSCTCPEGFTGEFCQTIDDPCANISCGANGTCIDGDCVCDQGYEGLNCEQETRDKFLGTYIVNETCQGSSDSYTMTIAISGSSAQQVNVTNLYNAGHTLLATVSGNDIAISSQTVSGITYTGVGTINSSGNVLTMNFQITDGTNSDSCSFTGTK